MGAAKQAQAHFDVLLESHGVMQRRGRRALESLIALTCHRLGYEPSAACPTPSTRGGRRCGRSACAPAAWHVRGGAATEGDAGAMAALLELLDDDKERFWRTLPGEGYVRQPRGGRGGEGVPLRAGYGAWPIHTQLAHTAV